MSQVYATYPEAYEAARQQADQLHLDVGIERTKEYAKTVFRTFLLPAPSNRYGFELRCEVVPPNSPRMESQAERTLRLGQQAS